jgi:hypothetical protein
MNDSRFGACFSAFYRILTQRNTVLLCLRAIRTPVAIRPGIDHPTPLQKRRRLHTNSVPNRSQPPPGAAVHCNLQFERSIGHACCPDSRYRDKPGRAARRR